MQQQNALVLVLGLVLVIQATADVNTITRTDINEADIDCGQGGARCRICGDINAIESSCQANPSCVAFTFDNSCGYLKNAVGPQVYREGFTTFVITNKRPAGATPPAAASPAAANTTPPVASPVQVSSASPSPSPAPSATTTPASPAASPAAAPASPAPASPAPAPTLAPEQAPAPAGPIQVSAPSRSQQDDSGNSGSTETFGRTRLFPIGGGFTGFGFPGRKLLHNRVLQ